jgi:hypothetical protein
MTEVSKSDFNTVDFEFERALAEHQLNPIPDENDEHDCTAITEGYCEKCGRWVDPAGGLHDADDDDPASMYA